MKGPLRFNFSIAGVLAGEVERGAISRTDTADTAKEVEQRAIASYFVNALTIVVPQYCRSIGDSNHKCDLFRL